MHDATHPDLRRNGLLFKATMLLLMCTVVAHVHAAVVENVDPVVMSSSLTLAKLDACHGHHCNNRRFSSSSRRNTAQGGEQYNNKDDDGDGLIGSPSSSTPRKRVCQLGSPRKVTSLDSVSFSYGTAVISPKNNKKNKKSADQQSPSSRVLVLPEIVTILSVSSSSSSSSSSTAAPSVNHQQQQQGDPPCEEALPVWLQRRMAARRSELAELYHLSAVLHITLNNSSVGIAYEDCMDTKSKNSSSSSSSSDVLPSKIQNNAATAAASDASMQDASWVCDSSIEDTLGLYHSLVAEKVMLTNIEVVCMVRSNSDGDGDEEAEEVAGSNWGSWLLDHHHRHRNATSCYLEYDTAHRPPVGGDLGLVVLFLWATLVMSLLWYLVASPSYHKRVASERLLKKFDDLQEWVSDREGRLRDAREGNGCPEGVSRAIPSVPIEQTATAMTMDSVTATAPHQRRVRKAAADNNNNNNNNHNSGSKNNDDDDNEHVSMLFHNPEKLTLRQMLYRQESNSTQLQSDGRGSDHNSNNNNNNNNSTFATTSDEVDESLRRHHRRGRDARRHADMYDDDESLIITYPIDGPL